MTLPSVSPRPYSQAELDDVEEVLRLGGERGHTAGVQVLRRAMSAQREFLALATQFSYVVPGHSAERERAPRHAAKPPRTEAPAQQSRCRHSDPTKGQCLRESHPATPNAHDYYRAPVTTRRGVPTPPMGIPAATFSSGPGQRAG